MALKLGDRSQRLNRTLLGASLRRAYDGVLMEDVPDVMLELLDSVESSTPRRK